MQLQILYHARLALQSCGGLGVAYTLIVFRRAGRAKKYQPVTEDWIFHCVFPFVAYTFLTVAAAMLPLFHLLALFGIAAFSLLLLFIGICNAWDTVTYVSATRSEKPKAD